jgi:hypothetical protein
LSFPDRSGCTRPCTPTAITPHPSCPSSTRPCGRDASAPSAAGRTLASSRLLKYGGRRPATRRRVQLARLGRPAAMSNFGTLLADLRRRRVGGRGTLRPCPWP